MKKYIVPMIVVVTGVLWTAISTAMCIYFEKYLSATICGICAIVCAAHFIKLLRFINKN